MNQGLTTWSILTVVKVVAILDFWLPSWIFADFVNSQMLYHQWETQNFLKP
jgi:hypothetical protein